MTEASFSLIPIEELFTHLSSSPDGLPVALAQERMNNRLTHFKKETRFTKNLNLFIRQFTNPLMLLLAIAVVLSALLGESSDSIIILIILFITGIFGYLQESNAGRAMEELQRMIEMKHTVLRGGFRSKVNTQEIVQGDVLLLDAGDIIPADCRIIESNELHVNESSLTGESFPAEKSAGFNDQSLEAAKKTNCLWQGTSVVSGTASALVITVGDQTEFGKLTHSLARTPDTAFEKGIRKFGYFLLRITIVLVAVILVVNLYFKRPLFDSVLFSLALAVGMSPELLPAIMTFAMSAGAKRMMKKKVIVKKLSSIFNFGEVNVLCTDKTGTITEGNVVVKDIVNVEGQSDDTAKLYCYLNATLQNGFANPVDKAITALAIDSTGFEKINEIPYDFVRRRLTVSVINRQDRLIITKGAFKNILEICDREQLPDGTIVNIDDGMRQTLQDRFKAWSDEGYRVMGLALKKLLKEKASREDEKDMIFMAYILLEDPLKDGAAASIERLKEQQIRIKIITGDNRYSAYHSAQKIGINGTVLTGDELDQLLPEALVVKVRNIDVFAEIEPHQKERIIKSLQKSNFIVAYIGDGINDVAAINAADIGISTNNAADIAKDAADFVLLEKDLSVLSDGVREGRKSFANSMKYIFINTGCIFGNMLSVAAASLFLPFLPMLPKQILLTNLLSDFPYLAIASDNVDKNQLNNPGKWDLKSIRNFMVVFGLHSSLFDFITFYLLLIHFHLIGSSFQTGWFIESVITELMILYVVRTRQSFIRSKPGKLIIISSVTILITTLLLPISPLADALGLSPLHFRQAIMLGIVLLLYLATADLVKLIFFRINDRRINKATRQG